MGMHTDFANGMTLPYAPRPVWVPTEDRGNQKTCSLLALMLYLVQMFFDFEQLAVFE